MSVDYSDLASEDDLQTFVLDLAELTGWRYTHFRPARTGKGWRTPVQGHKGWPDLVLAKGSRFLAVELKSAQGDVSDDQQAWLDALRQAGVDARVWRPADIDEIVATLKGQT